MRYLFAAGAVAVSLSLASCGGDSVDDLNGDFDTFIPRMDAGHADNQDNLDDNSSDR